MSKTEVLKIEKERHPGHEEELLEAGRKTHKSLLIKAHFRVSAFFVSIIETLKTANKM